MDLQFHNTLTRRKERFAPLDPQHVRMYVCGPTVYDFAHIGNARPVVVFDVLFRLLRHVYGEAQVTYARNITDVDDKILQAAKDTGQMIKSEEHTYELQSLMRLSSAVFCWKIYTNHITKNIHTSYN